MKTISGLIMAAFLVITCTTVAVSADTPPLKKAEAIQKAGEELKADIRKLMTRFQGVIRANALIKAAGLSYQSALVADTANTSAYTTPKQQALMAGVYTFDATYAALFLKKKEVAQALKARRALADNLGIGMAMPPKIKKMVTQPETINNFETCAEAFDELLNQLVDEQLTSDERIITLMDGMFGAVTQGLYVVSESIAQAGYPKAMIELMDEQLSRVNFMILLLNVFQGQETFETALAMEPRLKVLESVKGLMEVTGDDTNKAKGEALPFMMGQVTQKEVDQIREIVTPLREKILAGNA